MFLWRRISSSILPGKQLFPNWTTVSMLTNQKLINQRALEFIFSCFFERKKNDFVVISLNTDVRNSAVIHQSHVNIPFFATLQCEGEEGICKGRRRQIGIKSTGTSSRPHSSSSSSSTYTGSELGSRPKHWVKNVSIDERAWWWVWYLS